MDPVPKDLLSDRVYLRVRTAITEGAFSPGDRLVEYRIAQDLGVSQAPVREAMRRLRAEGIVEGTKRGATFVRAMSREQMRDVYEVRTELECMAARRAATRQPTVEDLSGLQTTLRSLMVAAKTEDVSRFVDLDLAVHREVFRLSGSPALAAAAAPLLAQTGAFVIHTGQVHLQDPVRTARLHRPIYNAIKSGDPGRAEAAIRRHVLLAWSGTRRTGTL